MGHFQWTDAMHTAGHARTYWWLYTRPITLPALTRRHHKR